MTTTPAVEAVGGSVGDESPSSATSRRHGPRDLELAAPPRKKPMTDPAINRLSPPPARVTNSARAEDHFTTENIARYFEVAGQVGVTDPAVPSTCTASPRPDRRHPFWEEWAIDDITQYVEAVITPQLGIEAISSSGDGPPEPFVSC